MRDYRKPIFICPECSRTMEIVTYLGEGMTKVVVECPICGVRETKTIVAETPKQG